MKKETAIYPSHRKLLGTTLAAAIMTTLSCLLVIVQPHGKVGLVIGIVGAVFFGGCICILFIVLLRTATEYPFVLSTSAIARSVGPL